MASIIGSPLIQATLGDLRVLENDLATGLLVCIKMGDYKTAQLLAQKCKQLKDRADEILAQDPTLHNGENI